MKNLSYLLGIFVIILGLVSIQQYRTNQNLERQVFSHYTNELSIASERMTDLQSSVHQSLLYKDELARNEELTNIWRLSSELKGSINKLPIDQETANEWNQYLSRLGAAAHSSKAEGGGDWATTMQQAAQNMDELVIAWQDAASSLFVLDGKMTAWNNLQLGKEPSSFAASNKMISGFRETDFPLTASESDAEKKRDLQFLLDENITKKEAIEAFQVYFPQIGNAALTVTKNKDDAPYSFYHIQFVQGSRIGYADVTEKGGRILSFLLERPVLGDAKSHEEIKQSAETFLDNVGYKDLVHVDSRENNNVWHFVYSRITEDDVIVYPDSIQIKVAKDSGEVLGVNAMEYIQQETLKDQKVVPLDIETFFQPDVTILEMKKIYTNDKNFDSRLCYEVVAVNNSNDRYTFRMIIDAETHVVHKVENLH